MKSWLVRLSILSVLLILSIPNLLSAPTVKIDLPKEARFGEDLRANVLASAWHYKFEINQVDLEITAADGSPSQAILVHKHPGGLFWWQSTGFFLPFWPSSKMLTLDLPLKKLSQERVVQPGILKGKLEVTIVYRPSLMVGWGLNTFREHRDFQIRLTQ